MPKFTDLPESRNHLRLKLTRKADMHGIVLPRDTCSMRRLQIPYNVPAPSAVNRLTCHRINLDIIIFVLVLHLTVQLPHDKPLDPLSYLNSDRPVPSDPDP